MAFNPSHFLTYHSNMFLSTPQGKALLSDAFGSDHPALSNITKSLNAHNSVLSKLALANGGGIMGNAPPMNTKPVSLIQPVDGAANPPNPNMPPNPLISGTLFR